MNPRIAVTGIGMVTALGFGADTNWAALTAGKSGIRRITRFDVTGMRARAEIIAEQRKKRIHVEEDAELEIARSRQKARIASTIDGGLRKRSSLGLIR